MSMTLGKRGAALIKGKETLRLVAYLPTPSDVPTIGWGHTRLVKLGMVCTAEQAELWFKEDTAEACAVVNDLKLPLTQAMFDALVSFVFNCGTGVLGSNLIVGSALRRRDWFGAWRGLSVWTKQAGKDLRGLAIRRAQEMALFMEDPLPK